MHTLYVQWRSCCMAWAEAVLGYVRAYNGGLVANKKQQQSVQLAIIGSSLISSFLSAQGLVFVDDCIVATILSHYVLRSSTTTQ